MYVTLETIALIILISFLVGLITGVILSRPNFIR